MEAQTVELTTLRQEVHELKRERRRQSKLIDRQKKRISESLDRVQTLRSLLAQPKNSASLERSVTSLAEDTLIPESDAEDGGDSPESESTARSKREHPMPVNGSVEEKWSEDIAATMDNGDKPT